MPARPQQGNVACLVTSHDAWVDRSQPPLGSLVVWLIHLRTGDRAILADHYETLARNQRWWRAARDPEGTGLMSCGTSDVGTALYKGTHFAARNETGMDNSATHDEAVYDPVTRCLSTWDLGLNCAIALDAEMLSLIAAALDRPGGGRRVRGAGRDPSRPDPARALGPGARDLRQSPAPRRLRPLALAHQLLPAAVRRRRSGADRGAAAPA